MTRRRPSAAAIAFVVLTGAYASAEMWIGSHRLSIQTVLFALAVAGAQTAAGWLALRAGGIEHTLRARLPAAFCVGFACLSLPMYAISSLLDVSSLAAFVVCAAGVGGVALRRRERPASQPVKVNSDLADVGIAALVAIALVVLTRKPVGAAWALDAAGRLPIWSDYFLHGITISSFGGPITRGTELELPGVDRVFYHYAPFLVPAAFQPISGLSGLALATSVLLPWGLMVAAMGCYTLATQISGRIAGLLAVVVLAATPAYRFPFQSGLFDFFWMVLASPGAGYAIGLSMVVCAAAAAYVDRGGLRTIAFVLLLLCSIVLIRVQFFMLLALPVAVFLGLRAPVAQRWAPHLAVCAALIIGAVAVVEYASLQKWLMLYNGTVNYLNNVLTLTHWRGEPITTPNEPIAIMLAWKVALVLVCVLGVFSVAYPVLAAAVQRRYGLARADLLVPLTTLSFIGLTLFAPIASNGDITEFKQRHFPLLYAMVVVYSISYAWRLVQLRSSDVRRLRRGGVLLAVGVLAAAALAGRSGNPSRPDVNAMPWSADFHDQPVAPGVLATAAYLRTHAARDDVLAMGGNAPHGQSPLLVDFVSLTGVPAFLTRSELRMARGACVRKTVEMRVDALNRIAAGNDWPQAQQVMRENGIRWFIVSAGQAPSWDPAKQAAIFSSEGMSVYDAGAGASNIRPPTQACD